MHKSDQSQKLSTIIDFIPLLAFFITHKLFGLITAALVLVVISLAVLIFEYVMYKKISIINVFSVSVVALFGSLTYIFDNVWFIKVKPTILSLIFALILFWSALMKKAILKYVFKGKLEMEDRYWFVLAYRFAGFFIFIAIINEIIWRNFSEEFWVSFKVFGILLFTLAFTASQAFFLSKHAKSEVVKSEVK